MIIRKYRQYPRVYTADLGEVIEARLSATYPFTRAVVTVVGRARGGAVRYKFQWMETNPEAGAVAGESSHVYVYAGDDAPSLVRQISKGAPRA